MKKFIFIYLCIYVSHHQSFMTLTKLFLETEKGAQRKKKIAHSTEASSDAVREGLDLG